MTIRREIDIETNDLFVIARRRDNNIMKMELALSDYIKNHLAPEYRFFLFLCDTFWEPHTRLTAYRGLWKRGSMKEEFGDYLTNPEQAFFIEDRSKVMFASCFELHLDDVYLAIERNATLDVGHSFAFISRASMNLSVSEIFESLNTLNERNIGNDWETLTQLLHDNQCVPIQKWVGGDEVSLRFFLIDQEDIFIEN